MQKQDPNILDVTVRDGGYLISHKYTPEKVAQIAVGLQEAGITHAEISHGVGIGGRMMGFPGLVDDEQLLEAAKEAAPNLNLTIFISPVEIALPILPGLLDFFEIGRIGCNVNQVSEAEKYVQKLKKYGKTASIQLSRCHALPPEEAAKGAKQAVELGADIVYVVDTFGSMLPEDVRAYLKAVKAEVKVPIGFHGHNTSGVAIPNALAAVDEGVAWVDASLMGVGRGSGNASLEKLVAALQERGSHSAVHLDRLARAAESLLGIFGRPPSVNYGELLLSIERIDFSPVSFLDLCAHAAGTSLEDFIMQTHHKMKGSLVMTEDHLKETLNEYGVDYQKLVEVLKGQ
ncbi:MAG TPA: hypothetical protein VJR29_12035 [bacterium]|nr:hypothetical protein [bacterium]